MPLYETFYRPLITVSFSFGGKVGPMKCSDGIGPVLRGGTYADTNGCSSDAAAFLTVFYSEEINPAAEDYKKADSILIFKTGRRISSEYVLRDSTQKVLDVSSEPELMNSAYRYTLNRLVEMGVDGFNITGKSVRLNSSVSSGPVLTDINGNPVPAGNPSALFRREQGTSGLCEAFIGPTPAVLSADASGKGVEAVIKLKARYYEDPETGIRSGIMSVKVTGKIFDMLGNYVTSIDPVEASTEEKLSIEWPAPCLNGKGRPVASGGYILRLNARYEDGIEEPLGTHKLIVLRPGG